MSVSSSFLCYDCKCALGFDDGFALKTSTILMRSIPLLLAFRKIWFCLGSPGLQWGWSARSGHWSTFCGISVSYLQSKPHTWVCWAFFLSKRNIFIYTYVFKQWNEREDFCCCSECYCNLNTKAYNICGYFDYSNDSYMYFSFNVLFAH